MTGSPFKNIMLQSACIVRQRSVVRCGGRKEVVLATGGSARFNASAGHDDQPPRQIPLSIN